MKEQPYIIEIKQTGYIRSGGHDLADLALNHILVYKSLNGDIILSLDIDS
jgi:hypothetical protein